MLITYEDDADGDVIEGTQQYTIQRITGDLIQG